ncbi:MAG: response regulator, partial [Pseudomonadales bacterium]|nr:response regulator [Pseudomonadales bacterium]
RTYLEMADVDQRLNKWLSYFGYFCLLPSIYSLLTGKPLDSVVTFAAFVFVILLVYSGIRALLVGKRQARFFLVAWCMLLLSILVFSGGLFELITLTPELLYSIHLGIAAEVILLSLGLADRINAMKSERLAMQKQLTKVSERRNEELVKALKTKDEFLATISHEMRTPINGMLGAVTLLKRDETELEKNKLLNSAEQAGYDMLQIVENLLCYTELQSGKVSLQKDVFELTSLIEHLVEEYQEKYLKEKVKVVVNNQLHDSWVESDKSLYERLLGAILDNAFKFTNEGEITVTCAGKAISNSQQLVIEVTDTGVGIPESELQNVFKPFYQVDQSFSRHFGGLGIGLSICSRLISLIDGELELTSKEHQGTTITLRIPIEFVAPVAANPSTLRVSKQIPQQACDAIKVLIVEDNKTNMMVTKSFVHKLGYQYVCAENGKEAVEFMRNDSADLILMDCQMPIMNGFEATALIRKLENGNRNIPILAVTANAMMEDREKCLRAGMNDHIAKPVNANLLQEKIEYWLQMAETLEYTD